jgi:hypothetical protein
MEELINTSAKITQKDLLREGGIVEGIVEAIVDVVKYSSALEVELLFYIIILLIFC